MSAPPPGYRVVAVLVATLLRLARWRIDVEGLEHVPSRGGAVLTWNHTSHVDVIVTALRLRAHTGRWVRFLALRELWDHPWLWWVPRAAHCVPVERGSADGRAAAYRQAVAALRAGDLVMVAPEGRISASAELLPFRTGATRMARDAGVPLVPTATWGAQHFVTTGRPPSLRRAWRLPVVVRVGAPLHVAAADDLGTATDLLRRRTAELVDTARAAHPDGVAATG